MNFNNYKKLYESGVLKVLFYYFIDNFDNNCEIYIRKIKKGFFLFNHSHVISIQST